MERMYRVAVYKFDDLGIQQMVKESADLCLEAAFHQRAHVTRELETRGLMGAANRGERPSQKAVIIDLGNGEVF